jgi:DNA-binding NtrC family response regulator
MQPLKLRVQVINGMTRVLEQKLAELSQASKDCMARLLATPPVAKARAVSRDPSCPSTIVGTSRYGVYISGRATERVFADVALFAPTKAPILITGRTGSGKERVAQAIHQASCRIGPMLALNCGAISNRDLVSAELFGYKKGAFTGAAADRVGLIESASGGTLFLDEIGEMPLEDQVKLLRVLQEMKVRPLGSLHEIAVDIRIVAATNRSLEGMVQNGTFREDLYYRLKVATIAVLPLSERPDEILPLAEFHLSHLGKELGRSLSFSPAVREVLPRLEWRGNVRELNAVVEAAMYRSSGTTIDIGHLDPTLLSNAVVLPRSTPEPEPIETQSDGDPQEARVLSFRHVPVLPSRSQLPSFSQPCDYKAMVDASERAIIEYVLAKSDGCIRRASRMFNIPPSTLRSRMLHHNLRPSSQPAIIDAGAQIPQIA